MLEYEKVSRILLRDKIRHSTSPNFNILIQINLFIEEGVFMIKITRISKKRDKISRFWRSNRYNIALSICLLGVVIFAAMSLNQDSIVSVFAQNTATRKLPIYSVETPNQQLSVTFDAAWGAEDTDTLLGILADFNVRATFFLCGYWVEKHPEEVRRIFDAGHDIGNHGDTHAHGNQLSLERNKQEIQGVHDKVKDLLGIEMDLFRPPFGEYNNTVIQAAEELGYFAIQWDVDSHDWMNKGPDYEINQVLNHKNLRNGSIILFHNGARDTPKTLPIILRGLQDRGFEMVPLSELIHRENFTINHEGRQIPNVTR